MIRVVSLGKSPTFWIGLALVFSFWLWAPQLASAGVTIERLRIFLIVFAGTVVVAYLPGVYHFLITRAPSHASQLVMGIVVAAIGVLGTAVWLLIWRLAGFPLWMVETYLNAFFIWTSIVGYLLHISAPRAIEGVIPTPNWGRIWGAFMVAIGVVVLVETTQPDMAAFVETIRPYVP